MDSDNVGAMTGAVTKYLRACPSNFEFPLGGRTPIPFAEELDLLRALQDQNSLRPDVIAAVRTQINMRQTWNLAIFSLRMAVHAARVNSLQILQAAVLALAFDQDQLDQRDVLVGLSIVEDCAKRLGTDLESLANPVTAWASRTVRDAMFGYLARSPNLRGLSVMGIMVAGTGTMLSYAKR